ncbi:MAG TPA: hypothetical protein VF214_03090 [Edaphobacter sp.]
MCLANSYKHGGRCVAGWCVEDNRWVRLRGQAEDGALCAQEYALDNGSEVALLDLIEVEMHFAQPSDWHPEDWQVFPVRWRLLERCTKNGAWQAVIDHADNATTILRGYRDRIAAEELRAKPLNGSLELVRPAEVWWWIREERGKRKYRALFRRHHVTYDFAVTDPRWLERLQWMPDGIYPHTTFVEKDAETWFTVSLSENFYGWHYKLVAGVIVRNGK